MWCFPRCVEELLPPEVVGDSVVDSVEAESIVDYSDSVVGLVLADDICDIVGRRPSIVEVDGSVKVENACGGDMVGSPTVVGDSTVVVGNVLIPIVGLVNGNEEEFPPLHSSVKKGEGKYRGRVNANSKNKFDVLARVDSEIIDDSRKPRATSLGVATLLQEIKARKVEKVKAKVPEAVGQVRVSFSQ
ncbi:hypothetical protein V6N12_031168 [Hibiscus sabdariffa]|uniref:Uncharacterized protein n=1 Tax=Hibiscus sabdariffa TaxID=183260 RepID=A0ABR2E853_9ROSI